MRQVGRIAEGSAPRWRTVVFLAACLLYFRYRLDPQLLHDSGTIVRLAVFGLDPLWLRDQLALPAGPLVLGCNWLVQWYYLPWVGPWMMLASVACLMAVTQGFADSLAGRRVAGVRFLPALLAVVLYNSQHHQLVVVLAVAVAGLAALGYVRLPDNLVQRGIYLLLALPSLLLVTAGAYLILLACVVFVEWRSERRRLLALLAIVYGEALPWLVTILLYDRPIASAYLDLLPISKIDTVIALAVVILWTLLPLLAIGLTRIAGRPVRARAWGWPGTALGLAVAARLGYVPLAARVAGLQPGLSTAGLAPRRDAGRGAPAAAARAVRRVRLRAGEVRDRPPARGPAAGAPEPLLAVPAGRPAGRLNRHDLAVA